MEILNGYSIAIPAYGRPNEFNELLSSIDQLAITPNEIIVCEDLSKDREELKKIAQTWYSIFLNKKCKLIFIENTTNLGYDANNRKLIQLAAYKWVILMGNDDVFLPDCLNIIDDFCQRNPEIAMISRPFLRFNKNVNQPIGISRFFPSETVINKNTYHSKYLFRVCGFFGGLVINKIWAKDIHTNKYDGSLYYQIYLASHAFCTTGIGYLAKPTVAARIDNIPLFGQAGAKDHVVGSYSAKARSNMWKGVLDIVHDVGKKYDTDIYTSIKHELTVQQSFHIFEMNANGNRSELQLLKTELEKLNLFNHWLPKFFYNLNYILGAKAKLFYYIIRKARQ